MQKPKVINVITRMSLGGSALQVLSLVEGLQARGYEPVLVTGTCDPEQGDLPIEVPAGLRATTVEELLPSISPWRDLAAFWRIYRLMRREQPGIVHTHTAKAGLVGRLAAWAARVPFIVHTFHGNSLSGYFSPPANVIFRGIEKMLARITDRIFVVSEQQFEELAGRFRIAPPGKFHIVPVGMDLSREIQQPVPVVKDGILHVGWLGRMVKIKDVPLLASIIIEAQQRGLSARFLVGGDGPARAPIKRILDRYGPEIVAWSGWQRDALEVVSRLNVLIQTSRNEGTPIALIQAMAAGRPFVSTAAGGIVDLVSGPELRHMGGCRWFANGVLAEPTPAAFVNALKELEADPGLLASMGEAARRVASERYRAERLVNDVDRLYREVGVWRTVPSLPNGRAHFMANRRNRNRRNAFDMLRGIEGRESGSP